MSAQRVLVTGATGFVGRILCQQLMGRGYTVRAALRSERPPPTPVAEQIVVGELTGITPWQRALAHVDAVIHLAARVHVLREQESSARAYQETNALATRHLAEAASRAAVRRFVFVSSVKVNGEDSAHGAYSALDAPQPSGAYAASKWLAEQDLREIAARTAMPTAVVRPPLVYGPHAQGNFLRLLRWVDAQWPLPLAAIDNRRSLVSVWNLCDLLVNLLDNPAAPGTWMVSDGEDLSTPELIRCIGRAMGRRVRLWPAPVAALRTCARLIGRSDEAQRLCGSLAIDIERTRELLGWSPQVSVEEGLARTVHWYLSEARLRER